MSKKLLFLAGILLTIVLGIVLFCYNCCDCVGKNQNMGTVADDQSVVPDEQLLEPPAPEASPSVDWPAIKNQLNDNPPTPLFQPYQTERTLGQNDANKVNEIIDYLDNNPDGSLLVVGHADISGPRDLNIKLSRQRADFLKNYLVQKGIDTGKIETSHKGPDEPAHDNGTAEGRAKNRRAVVLIK